MQTGAAALAAAQTRPVPKGAGRSFAAKPSVLRQVLRPSGAPPGCLRQPPYPLFLMLGEGLQSCRQTGAAALAAAQTRPAPSGAGRSFAAKPSVLRRFLRPQSGRTLRLPSAAAAAVIANSRYVKSTYYRYIPTVFCRILKKFLKPIDNGGYF